ncbi:MAG: hypothetical protein DBW72_06305 [Flavobacteriales bacterium]|nr:MAG: hypothetical protein DBW72_06305 [Flavobacteriales bacterium]
MVKQIIHITVFFFFSLVCYGQQGCTDPLANNYMPSATINDGSCEYDLTNHTMNLVTDLFSPTLNENSGIIFFNGHLFSINDGGNSSSIFEMDTMGSIIREITVTNAINVDWEAISHNSQSIFVGDFGNNSGSREDLCIYEISKQDIQDSQATEVTAIRRPFRFEDQLDFNWASNAHNFDCEALISTEDSIYLFSKNWLNEETKLYILPAAWSDTAVAILSAGFNVDGLITDATSDSISGRIMLLGYKNNGGNLYTSFIWMFWDYQGSFLFSGNKRRIEIGSMFTLGQTEGIALYNSTNGYVSSEQISSVITIPPKLFKFDFSEYLGQEVLGFDHTMQQPVLIYPNPGLSFITIEERTGTYCIYEYPNMRLVEFGKKESNRLDISGLKTGTYLIELEGVMFKFKKGSH